MDIDAGMTALKALAIPGKGEEMRAYHKVDRIYLGVANPDIDELCRAWRKQLSLDDRLDLAKAFWATDVHEARVAAAKLLTQARIKPDDQGAWELIKSWVPDFDAWATADHASIAGQKRLVANPDRVGELVDWVTSDHMWTRRAALVMTLPWARMRNPKDRDMEIRETVLEWAAQYVSDREWFMQKVVAWWLRDLSKKDPERVREFLDQHGSDMKAFAHKESSRYLDPSSR